MTENNKNVGNDGRFVVVGIRHFMNGEHHWMAPESGVDYADDAEPFGAIGENESRKPLFGKVDDAANWAMAMQNGEWALAQWEYSRPTFLVIPDEVYAETVGRASYPLPAEAEQWNDAKVVDFERDCDCKGFAKAAVWDSDAEGGRAVENTH